MNEANFESQVNGKSIQLFRLSSHDLTCYFTNYGARIVSLETYSNQSKKVDVVLGFNSIDEYLNASEQYHGASVGRFANRIANGSFTVDNKTYSLTKNNGGNSLHGGIKAFHNSVWECVAHNDEKITFELISAHMEEGFPGEMRTQVTYSLIGSTLKIDYKATSTQNTIINLTHHSYFNLNGEGMGSILNHNLKINAEYYTPVNENTIPTGSLDMVTDTPFDFTSSKTIGADIENDNEQLSRGSGYDHNFVLNQYVERELNFVAQISGEKTGILMEVWSSEPGVQFYSANHLDGSDIGKSGNSYEKRNAFCLETQHFPDSPNHSHFPTTFLGAEALFESSTEYRFSTI